MIIKGVYTSKWEEGDIITQCLISLTTGEIVDVEVSDEGDNYESHIKDEIQVEVGNEYLNIDVDDEVLNPEHVRAVQNKFYEKLAALL